jgi:hypothetical protein
VALAGELSGRRARWEQISLDLQGLVYAILFDILELQLAGYPIGVIRKFWQMQKDRSVEYQIALALLALPLKVTSSSSLTSSLAQVVEKFARFRGAGRR